VGALRSSRPRGFLQVAHITSISLLGMFIGSIVGGRLADRVGPSIISLLFTCHGYRSVFLFIAGTWP
jgi:MFS family permease